jgi:prepilin-type N-terminal cleavage/methylation domain-containing protein
MRIKTNRKSGFTLVEIMIVVAIIGLLAAIAIPNFVKARGTAQKNACINNLRQIDGAKEQWALENRASAGANVSTDATTGAYSYIKGGVVPVCPAGGTYTPGAVNADPTCSLDTAAEGGHTLNAPAATTGGTTGATTGT